MKTAIEVLEEMATEFEAQSRGVAKLAKVNHDEPVMTGIGQAMSAAAVRLRARADELRGEEAQR
jgi:hypothetical protein